MYEYTAQVLRVIDGDTLDLSIDLGFNVWITQRCRLQGIDTPETHTLNAAEKVLGLKAKGVLEGLVKTAKTVTVKTAKEDKYGRVLVTLFLDLININESLVASGYAWRYDGGTKDRNLADLKETPKETP